MEANAEALFKNRTLDEIREVEARTRREAREKAEALRCVRARRDRRPGLTDALRTRRKLLGESYKDAIATVEALEIIEETSRSVAQTSREIERALREMNESVDRSSEREIGEEDARRAAAVERGSRVKFLLDTPEKMWGLLEDCAYEEAAIRLMASVEMLGEMTRGKGRAEALYATFPVARQQATALNSFKARVSKRARAGTGAFWIARVGGCERAESARDDGEFERDAGVDTAVANASSVGTRVPSRHRGLRGDARVVE